MGKVINLNMSDLRQAIKESVHSILKEGFGPSTDFQLSDDFQMMAEELKQMAWQLGGFVQEFPKFAQIMQEQTQRFGLVLKNASTDDSFDMDDVVRGGNANFEYDYRLPNIDVYSMSDDEYDALSEKLENMCSEIEIYLDNRDFKFGQVSLSTNESGVDISYTFNFWK